MASLETSWSLVHSFPSSLTFPFFMIYLHFCAELRAINKNVCIYLHASGLHAICTNILACRNCAQHCAVFRVSVCTVFICAQSCNFSLSFHFLATSLQSFISSLALEHLYELTILRMQTLNYCAPIQCLHIIASLPLCILFNVLVLLAYANTRTRRSAASSKPSLVVDTMPS